MRPPSAYARSARARRSRPPRTRSHRDRRRRGSSRRRASVAGATQSSSGPPMVKSAPGIGPTLPASACVHAAEVLTGLGTRLRSIPERTKNIPSVAITGGKRSRAISRPLTAPTAAPSARQDRHRDDGSAERRSAAGCVTRMMLTRPISGAIERSMPPLPLRKAGVLAIPAIANGASVPIVGASCPLATKFGSAMRFATNSEMPKISAAVVGHLRARRSSGRVMRSLARSSSRRGGRR